MLSKIQSKIRTTEGISKTFDLTTGRMQGECLSPTLFIIYINSLSDIMKSVNSMRVKIDNNNITVLKYADDLVLMASSGKGLQEWLVVLKQYCTTNKLVVNTSKSKLLYFPNIIKKDMTALYYNNEQLEWMKTFKFLGITSTPTNKFKHKSLSVEHSLQLFRILIQPRIMFDAELWGVAQCEQIDTYFIGFLKKTLHVKSTTNTCMIYAETGTISLSIQVSISYVKYWLKVIKSDND